MGGAGSRRKRESDEESDEDYAPPRRMQLEEKRLKKLREAEMEREAQLRAEREAEAAQRQAEAAQREAEVRQERLAARDVAWLAALAQNGIGKRLHLLGVGCVEGIAGNDEKLVEFLELVPLDQCARWALVSRRWRRAALEATARRIVLDGGVCHVKSVTPEVLLQLVLRAGGALRHLDVSGMLGRHMRPSAAEFITQALHGAPGLEELALPHGETLHVHQLRTLVDHHTPALRSLSGTLQGPFAAAVAALPPGGNIVLRVSTNGDDAPAENAHACSVLAASGVVTALTAEHRQQYRGKGARPLFIPNRLRADDVVAIAGVLAASRSIKRCRLDTNIVVVNEDAVLALCAAIEAPTSVLEELNLRGADIQPAQRDQLLSAAARRSRDAPPLSLLFDDEDEDEEDE